MEFVTESRLTCSWIRYDVVNFAMQQNFVPVVRKITLTNTSTSDMHLVKVKIEAEPEFASVWSKTVDVIPAGQTVEIGAVPIEMSGTCLAGLTERLTGSLTLEAAVDDDIIYRERSPVTVLAYDQWGGLSSMPEMAAAFILPNHPAVAGIIREAAPYLTKWTGNPSFDAYQSQNPNRVRQQAAALFAAIQAHQPTYCVSPAGFEEVGQRVRLPDAVLGGGMGNCLDLTFLFAACLEAVGLHPLVVFLKGHAFAGVWLVQETFSESVQDDGSLLTKRLAAGVHEVSVAEATLMCAGSRSSYKEAESDAASRLAEPDRFVGFIDVLRARFSAIRPLPIRIPTPDGWKIVQAERKTEAEAPDQVQVRARPVEASAIPLTKQKQWERGLLDLTLRNTLLNFRLTKAALPLLNSRLSELEDALADGQEFQLVARPSDWDKTARSADLFQSIGQDHPLNLLLHQEFLNKRLRTDVGDRELADKTVHLYRSARLSLEENGANTLYLALGLLKWYESPASEMPRFAPIVLVPVELVRKTSRAGVILRTRDEEPQINITLLEMLRQDFESDIGGLDPLPRDEKGIDLSGIFTAIRHVVMHLPRWDIVESAILGLFSFSRFVMWNDIRSRADDLAKNKVVASLMSGRLEWESGETFPEPGRLDELYAPEQLLLPISADSSQVTAVSAASHEKSFVLHGPPGTGKSQTITNMIASSLASGKTVLFVAEKMAALSVVQSRLEQIGLGPFCLELHSNKSTKKAVLEQLRRTLETAHSASPEEWKRQAERLASSRSELNSYVTSLHKTYGFGASLYDASVLAQLHALPSAIPTGLLRNADPEAASAQIVKAVQHGRSRKEARTGLTAHFSNDILDYDAAVALSEWRRAELQWFLAKYLTQKRVYKAVKSFSLSGSAPQQSETAQILALILQYQTDSAELKKLEIFVSPMLGAPWNNGDLDWEAANASHAWAMKLREILLQLYRDVPAARQAGERMADLLAVGKEAFQERYGRSVAEFLSAHDKFRRLEEQLAKLLRIDWIDTDGKRDGRSWFDYRADKAQQWLGHIGSQREWCSWRQVRDRAVEAGLGSLVSAYENGHLQHSEVTPSFERAWWKAAIDLILEMDPQLASFSGRLFEEKIKAFQETVETFERLTRQEIAARLAANIPPLVGQAAASSEAGILLRAIRSGGRGLSLRKLFEQIPNLLSRICPCVLMSPMSVAQYLDPKFAPFDLVIFDEASQLPTSAAVGAMARGRNVIVVGDPKQLPPTSFFTHTKGDDSDDAVVPEDLESILDDCLALGMPQEHLLWHYRSRHESLIAFSNRHFYENKLLTFPSPFERKSNVRWHPVDGYYDRGKTKHNRAEAGQVIQEIARRLRDPELGRLSMGVVTFNTVQQTLIEDMLDDAFRQDHELEQMALNLYEPIFIKNLENVQGDERDVILFSIGYGPDAAGKVVLNFGPLNREGGWRRLNVAVSRARHEMHVFSTLRADHLDVSRTQAQGVNALRSFLEYAEKGKAALGMEAGHADVRAVGIEAQIAAALEKQGYKLDLHVGASGYRVDLAIVNPEHPDTYLLAVLCDGSGYRTGNTARDREVLREQVLRKLGWRIHRVWSMDWLDSPEKEIARLLEALKAAEETEPASALEPQQPSQVAEEPSENGAEYKAEAEPVMVSAQETWRTAYQPAAIQAASLSSEEFYSPLNERIVMEQLAQVIKEEGPICRSLLGKRVLHAWGMTRSGARIERHLGALIASMDVKTTVWDGVEFYWPDDIRPEQYAVYRVSENEQDRRSPEELPPEEVANAVKEVLFLQGSLPLDDLIKETAKLLGYARAGAALEKALRHGIEEAERRGAAEIDNGRVSYKRR